MRESDAGRATTAVAHTASVWEIRAACECAGTGVWGWHATAASVQADTEAYTASVRGGARAGKQRCAAWARRTQEPTSSDGRDAASAAGRVGKAALRAVRMGGSAVERTHWHLGKMAARYNPTSHAFEVGSASVGFGGRRMGAKLGLGLLEPFKTFGIGFLLEAARVVDVRIKPASTVADETRRLAHADRQCRSVRISPGGGTSFRLSFEKERKL
ncbi:hypothetical protein B0H14DRAFT_2608571 [Mycena olivaceomarginata]|nr:hypothetical protein B0H14DRAFT_2608571 [Mycena olivaceomarginata]